MNNIETPTTVHTKHDKNKQPNTDEQLGPHQNRG